MAAINGGIFTAHFRQRMMLRHHARMVSYVPSMFVPFYTTALAQQPLANEHLLGTKNCLPCADISAASYQVRIFRILSHCIYFDR